MRIRIKDLNFDKLKILVNNNKKAVKTAMTIMIILIAVLFFGMNGEKDSHISITHNQDIAMAESTDEEQGAIGTNKGNETETSDNGFEEMITEETVDTKIYCDISGEVVNPGVYVLEEGERLEALINAAGGLTEEADIDLINRARVLTDGEKVFVPKIGSESFDSGTGLPMDYPDNEYNNEKQGNSANGLININTASQRELETIPGVGPVTAKKIIDYRDEYGRFDSINDLTNVSGIGEKTLKKLEPYITV